MVPTPVRIGLMDSRRPGLVAMLPARHLTVLQRVVRATKRFFGIGGLSLLLANVLLVLVPIPWVHFCTLPIALVLGPIVGVLALKQRVLLGACEVGCPRCAQTVSIPEAFPGWPARLNCLACGIRVELDGAPPNVPVERPRLLKVG